MAVIPESSCEGGVKKLALDGGCHWGHCCWWCRQQYKLGMSKCCTLYSVDGYHMLLISLLISLPTQLCENKRVKDSQAKGSVSMPSRVPTLLTVAIPIVFLARNTALANMDNVPL